jgi:2'-hydroxyisoflavone reductase
MRILILGGTIFLGRALVEAALARGHQVTLFNRGRSNPGSFPEIEQLHGDRRQDLSALEGRRWEAVIDTSGYLPGEVRRSAEKLSGAADHYTFISSLSVYADSSKLGTTEEGAVGALDDPTVEEVTGETYGPLKALCEQAAADIFRERALILRPGLIVGPYDPSDRFTYWPYRVSQGGEVLAPGRPERLVQFIDVRDLAEWNLELIEAGKGGVYNAVGPDPQPAMRELLNTCRAIANNDARFTWVSDDFLVEQEAGPWIELPLWLPETGEVAGFFAYDNTRAVRDGLKFRLLADTVGATMLWAAARPDDLPWKAGLTRQREAELLAAWHDKEKV